jgi:hypothetical protein
LAFRERKVPNGLDVWGLINHGPAEMRPTSINTFEPLRKVRDVNVEEVCKEDFIWRNGRKCLGMFNPVGFNGKATLSIILEYPHDRHGSIVPAVYEFIRSNFDFRLLYGVSPSDELFEQKYPVYKLANCGAIPPDESIITANKELFEYFEAHS